MNLDGLDRRLSKLEEKSTGGRYEWRTSDGTKVSFDRRDMHATRGELMTLQYLALRVAAGEPEDWPPVSDALAALLATDEHTLARLGRGDVLQQWEWVQNPPPEGVEYARGYIANDGVAGDIGGLI